MKVGDKVICIKDRFNISDEYYNKKGEEYIIVDIHNNNIKVTTEKNKYHCVSHYSTQGKPSQYYLFKNYFMTKKQERKSKINKLAF